MNSPASTAHNMATDTAISSYFANVYKWMTLALGLTTFIAWYVSNSPAISSYLSLRPTLLFGLIIVELGLVVYLAARVHKMSYTMAVATFLIYAALNGVTLSWIFLEYTSASIFQVFLVTTGMYAATSIFGYTTKRDLSGLGSFLFMALIGLIIGGIVNIWLASPMIDWIFTFGGIVIFAGLSAYDHQKLKQIAVSGGPESMAIYGALDLYLDFINLFLLLLRVMGSRD